MKLRKELTLLEVFCITAGAIMSSGMFLLPGMAYARAGPAVILSYLLAALLAATGMLSQAELASAMPKAGGTYFYVMRSMGGAVGTVYGLITFLALALKSAFELIGISAFLVLFLSIDIRIAAVPLCLVFILVNLVGAKEAGRLQVALVFLIMAALLFYVIHGLPYVRVSRFEPFMAGGEGAVLKTAGFVFLSFGGLLKIASLAEEVKEPGRVLPLGMILSLLAAVGFYTVVIFVTVGVLEPESLSTTLTPISDGAGEFMGGPGRIILSLAAILAFISAANAGIMGASRYPLALARDEMLPRFLSRINARFKTPHFSILATGIFMIAAMFLKLEVIVKTASSVLILTYIFSCLALIILKESRLQNYQPSFSAPLYPWLQVIGIIGFCVLLFSIGKEALLAGSILLAGGLFVYWFYGRIRTEKEHALLHLIERITARELTGHSLETELKQIIKERDDISKDRFDWVIEHCAVLDIEEGIDADEFFRIAAETLADKLNIEPEILLDLLVEREKDSSTVISPGLAIPHVIIEGEHTFDITLARCRNGVTFPCSSEPVHAIFVLAGTKDERNFHLRALSAFAQIVQDTHFDKKWLAAKNRESLRDLVLLGKRKR